ncbi:MAG: hypothetical protein RMY36_024885 [Nostoc sp. SerVER01]|uniref:hypothetical protein n=1 Tax=Nostoc sp. CCY 9925 TaxID=3103865 RepID=UPI002ADCEB79|nr:hypothetical protein [Nostoc sp. SerVER01]MDZ8028100.1 hypothetical protein [Nostoc sp. DedQUE11]MDZ8073102.1 hypothetical protein [Nostoc sp. DedQUE01]
MLTKQTLKPQPKRFVKLKDFVSQLGGNLKRFNFKSRCGSTPQAIVSIIKKNLLGHSKLPNLKQES